MIKNWNKGAWLKKTKEGGIMVLTTPLFNPLVAVAYSELASYQRKHDVNPLRGFLVPLVQVRERTPKTREFNPKKLGRKKNKIGENLKKKREEMKKKLGRNEKKIGKQ